MKHILKPFLIAAASTLVAGSASIAADIASDLRSLHASASASPSKLPPDRPAFSLPTLDHGVFIRPVSELPFLAGNDFEVLPRISYINVTVDGGQRREMVIVYSLEPGPHKVLIELTDSTHAVVASETVEFTLPDPRKLVRPAVRVPTSPSGG